MLWLPPWVKEKQEHLLRYLERWGIDTQKIQDFELFLCAFVHKSYASDFKEVYLHNERLEFVWDAALGAVIAKALFLNFPWMQESTMTLYKIALVREETLAEVAQKIWLNQQIFISKGEEKNKGREKASITSDALEALIGYLYLDMGFEVAEKFVLENIYPKVKEIAKMPVKSYKTMAQEMVQKVFKVLPTYKNFEKEVDDKGNVLLYNSEIWADEILLASWEWTNKKKAQEDAAKNYYEKNHQE